ETLQTVLSAQDLPSGSASQIKESLQMLEEDQLARDGSLVIVEQGQEVVFSYLGELDYQLDLEGGDTQRGTARKLDGNRVLVAPQTQIGYHQLQIGNINLALAVAPQRCPAVTPRAGQAAKPWGVVAQLYSLRRASETVSEQDADRSDQPDLFAA